MNWSYQCAGLQPDFSPQTLPSNPVFLISFLSQFRNDRSPQTCCLTAFLPALWRSSPYQLWRKKNENQVTNSLLPVATLTSMHNHLYLLPSYYHSWPLHWVWSSLPSASSEVVPLLFTPLLFFPDFFEHAQVAPILWNAPSAHAPSQPCPHLLTSPSQPGFLKELCVPAVYTFSSLSFIFIHWNIASTLMTPLKLPDPNSQCLPCC